MVTVKLYRYTLVGDTTTTAESITLDDSADPNSDKAIINKNKEARHGYPLTFILV